MLYTTTPRHKVFVSYHHLGDEYYKTRLTEDFNSSFKDESVRPKEVDDNLGVDRIRQIIRDGYIRDATVTIVLVGLGTWRRKHVDWEIDSSLRSTKYNSQTGLLGIVLLPSYQTPGWDGVSRVRHDTNPRRVNYCPNRWIHEAYLRRDTQPNPNLSRATFRNNRPNSQSVWEPAVV